MKKFLLSAVVLLLSLSAAQAQYHDKVIFKFYMGLDGLYVPFSNNDVRMKELFNYIDANRAQIQSGAMPIYVDGYATSKSTDAKNRALASVRSNRVKSEMITHRALRESNFVTKNHVATYGDFKDVVVVTFGEPVQIDVVDVEPSAPLIEYRPAEVTEDTVGYPEVPMPVLDIPHFDDRETHFDNYKMGLRTNLAHWILLTPNLGVDLRSHRLGLNLNGAYSHWNFKDGDQKHRVWYFNPEARYYMGNRGRFYAGLQYTVGNFNFKFAELGHQGDVMGGGITTGYQARLSRSFDVDFGVGFGVTDINYETYNHVNGEPMVSATGMNKQYWGLNQVSISLVWKIIK